MKFKIGDVCEVVKEVNDHKFEIGEHVRIVDVNNPEDEGYMAEKLDRSDYWYVADEELELVEEVNEMVDKPVKARVIDSVVVLIDERFSDTGYNTFSVGMDIGGQKVADIIQDNEKNIFWVFDENEEIVAEIRDCPVVIYYKDAPEGRNDNGNE